jgi:hypothetical protein
MKTCIITVLLGAILVFGMVAQSNQNVNLTGTWQIEYHDNNGKEVDTPMVSLLQSNGRLEGVFGNQHWKVQGAVTGNQITFSFSPPKHPEIMVRYQGTLESATQMRGTMASQVQSGTFVATRKW